MNTDHGHARAGAARTTRSIGRIGVLALAALVLGFLPTSQASADEEVVVASGTWSQYPTGGTEYQAEVQPPINTANTSNWSAKSKGGIPVMFKLSSRPAPAAFESIFSDNPGDTSNDYAYVSFTPASTLTFNDIYELKTDYEFTLGDCHGGALRWSVRTADGRSLWIYYGVEPQFGNGGTGGCTPTSLGGDDQSGDNILDLPGLRFDTTAFGGTFYDSYANAKVLMGDLPVQRATLALDGGWGGDQRATISNTTVNGNSYDFDASGGGAFTPTCDLPAASIEVGKADAFSSGDVNEAPVQASLADSGSAFRVVDCKYQYVLSIPTLSGKGTYEVQIWIDGEKVPTPASAGGRVLFDLK